VIRVLLPSRNETSIAEEDDMNPNLSDEQQKDQGRVQFKCSDVVAKNCDWRVVGNSEEEIMPLIEQHSDEKHGLKLDDEIRNGVHHAIHKQAA
jgi:predicted small metal-binding protein